MAAVALFTLLCSRGSLLTVTAAAAAAAAGGTKESVGQDDEDDESLLWPKGSECCRADSDALSDEC